MLMKKKLSLLMVALVAVAAFAGLRRATESEVVWNFAKGEWVVSNLGIAMPKANSATYIEEPITNQGITMTTYKSTNFPGFFLNEKGTETSLRVYKIKDESKGAIEFSVAEGTKLTKIVMNGDSKLQYLVADKGTIEMSNSNKTLTWTSEEGVQSVKFENNNASNTVRINDITFTKVEPVAQETWTVAGSNTDLFGKSWDPTATANDMTLVEGLYTWSKSDVTLPAGVVGFKVVKNHKWDDAYPAQNYELNIEQSGKYDVTITFDAETKVVNAVATFKEAAVVDPVYVGVGVEELWGTAWDANNEANKLTKGDDGKFRITKEGLFLEVGEYGYKIVKDGSWIPDGEGNEQKLAITEKGIYSVTLTVDPTDDSYLAEAEKTAGVITIAQAQAAEAGTEVLIEGVVFASAANGAVIKDDTDVIYYYNTANALTIGQKVLVKGAVSVYGGANQLTAAAEITNLGTVDGVVYPDAVEMKEADFTALDGVTTVERKYVTYQGTLAINGNYFNLTIGESKVMGSLVKPNEDLSELNGKTVVVKGYQMYTTTTKQGQQYVYTVATSVEAVPEPIAQVLADGAYYLVSGSEGTVVAADGTLKADGSRMTFTYDESAGGATTIAGADFFKDKQWFVETEDNYTITIRNAENQYVSVNSDGLVLSSTVAYWLAAPAEYWENEEMSYNVAGTEDLCGAAWDATKNKMTYNEESKLFEWKAENIAVSNDVKPEFKVVATLPEVGSVWYPEGGNETNWVITLGALGEGATEGLYNITITFNAATKAIAVAGERTGDIPAEKTFADLVAEAIAAPVAGVATVTLDKDYTVDAAVAVPLGTQLVIDGANHTLTLGAETNFVLNDNITLKNVKIDATELTKPLIAMTAEPAEGTKKNQDVYTDAAATDFNLLNAVTVENVMVKNLKVEFISSNGADWALENFSLTKSIIQLDATGKKFIAFDATANNKGAIKNITISENTIYNINETSNAYFIRFANASNAAKAFGTSNGTSTFDYKLTKNTIVNTFKAQNFGNNTPNNAKTTIEATQNIFADVKNVSKFVQNNCTKTVEKNVAWGEGAEASISEIVETPVFTAPTAALDLSAENGGIDLTIDASSKAAEYQSGDPRWVVPYVAPIDVEDGFYLAGTMNDWTPAQTDQLTANTEAEGVEYVLANVNLLTDAELKIVKIESKAISAWYPAEAGNLKVTADGKYDIYFRPNADGGDDWYEHVIYLAASSTGINGVKNADALKDAQIYTISGQRVEKAQKGLYIVNGKKVVIK